MKIHVVVNQRAGTVLDWDAGPLREEILSAFRQHGHEVTLHLVSPEAVSDTISRVLAQGCQAVIVGGGDGTVRAAATALIDSKVPLGILPLGTLNRLARDLKIPLTIPEAAASLATGDTTSIDVAEVNGRIFLCNSTFGLPALFSAHRQSLRGKAAFVRFTGYLSALKEMLQSRRRMDLDIDHGHSRMRLRVLSMAVSNNRYVEKASLMLEKEGLHHGVLAAYVSQHPSGWGMARAVVRAMLGRFKSDPHIAHFEAHEIGVSAPRSRVRLANDGELEIFNLPLKYRIRPGALKVLVPANASQANVERSQARANVC
jgi:diacylglycerol kinase family enzyme